MGLDGLGMLDPTGEWFVVDFRLRYLLVSNKL